MILLVSHSSSLYGAERSFLDLAGGLATLNEQFIAFCPGQGPLTEALKKLNVKVIIMPVPGLGKRSFYELIRFILLWLPTVLRFRQLIRKHNISLIYNNTVNGVFAPFAAVLAGIPCIWHIRETRPDFILIRKIFALIFKLIPSCTIFNSFATMRAYSTKQHSLWHVIYNGTDMPQSFTPRLDTSSFVIGYAGQINHHKRPERFIYAFALAKRFIPHLKGIMIGDGLMLSEIRSSVVRLGLHEYIDIPGYVESISQFYTEIDVLVLTSDRESFGRVIAEAMSYGCPVIAAAVGGVSEIIEDGISGYLVKSDDITAYAEKIIELEKDPALRSRMGEAARNRIFRYFGKQRYIQEMADIIHKYHGFN